MNKWSNDPYLSNQQYEILKNGGQIKDGNWWPINYLVWFYPVTWLFHDNKAKSVQILHYKLLLSNLVHHSQYMYRIYSISHSQYFKSISSYILHNISNLFYLIIHNISNLFHHTHYTIYLIYSISSYTIFQIYFIIHITQYI